MLLDFENSLRAHLMKQKTFYGCESLLSHQICLLLLKSACLIKVIEFEETSGRNEQLIT